MSIINYMSTVDFDFAAVAGLETTLSDLGIARPMLVTDPGIVDAGIVDQTQAHLSKCTLAAIFDQTPSNPTEEAVGAGVQMYHRHGCDGLVALGGGSSIDLAKVIALMSTHLGPLSGYSLPEGGSARITDAAAPLIAIPTTAGTGSEVGRAALIAMVDGRKIGFISKHLIPRAAICDPELCVGLPPQLTAATGMDALSHCIETFLSPTINPPAEAIALDGLARALSFIEKAVADGSDREARWQMMMASLEGGLAFQKGLGAVHALSHPLGGLRDPVLHHGTLNAVLLPAVLRFNANAAPGKFETLRAAMGSDPAQVIAMLNQRLGLPASLAAMGVPEPVLPRIAEAAARDHCTATNPRPASVADYRALLEETFEE
jgi:4-hydroxybutyrate dehydrogenase